MEYVDDDTWGSPSQYSFVFLMARFFGLLKLSAEDDQWKKDKEEEEDERLDEQWRAMLKREGRPVPEKKKEKKEKKGRRIIVDT